MEVALVEVRVAQTVQRGRRLGDSLDVRLAELLEVPRDRVVGVLVPRRGALFLLEPAQWIAPSGAGCVKIGAPIGAR
jgi:hypothetical protein